MGCRAAGDVLGGSQDYSAQQSHHSSISLCICIFSVLIVVISAFYFILVVNSSSKDCSRLLDYMLIISLILHFLFPVPFVIPVSQYSCILRHSAPTLAFSFSISLSSVLVNLLATFGQTIYTVTPAQVSTYRCSRTLESLGGLVMVAVAVMVAVMLSLVQVIVTAVAQWRV